MRRIILILIATFLFPVVSFAQTTWYVDDDAPNDPGPNDPTISDPLEDGSSDHPFDMIQEGIDAAANDDTVLVASGMYLENIDFKGKKIVVVSESGPNVTTIDGNQTASVVTILESGSGTVLDGFTITNGPANHPNGSGIHCYKSAPTIRSNKISDNLGNAIYCEGYPSTGVPEIMHNFVTGNSGAGILTEDAIISNNTIQDNEGTGINCIEYADVQIRNNVIAANSSGVCCEYYGDYIIENNIICSNSSTWHGAGIYVYNCFPLIMNNIIFDNSTTTKGGGIYCFHYACPDIINNVICGNHADELGGGIYCENESYINMYNNTLFYNSAGSQGGGIAFHHNYAFTSLPEITDCILWNNRAPIGPQLSLVSSDATIKYSDVMGGQASVYLDPLSDLDWGDGMIEIDPLFVDAAGNDFHLTCDSPCRDAGDNSTVIKLFDFEGDPRIAWGGTVDMGADEFYTHLYCTGDFTPGGSIKGKLVGLPGTTPVGLFIGSGVRETPAHTAYGDFWLLPPRILLPLIPIPSNGILAIPTTIPLTPPAPYDLPMQGLVGLNDDSLTNLYVLEVR